MARSSVRTHLPIHNEKKNKQTNKRTNQTKAQCRLLLNISKFNSHVHSYADGITGRRNTVHQFHRYNLKTL